jgi:hypothetical protein
MPQLTPVEGNPFAPAAPDTSQAPATSASGATLTPVDHDPFASNASTDTSKAAPDLGVWNALKDAVKSIPNAISTSLADTISASGRAGAIEMGGQMADDIPDADQYQKLIEKEVTGPQYTPQTEFGKLTSGAVGAMANPMSYLGAEALPIKLGAAALSGMGGELGGQIAGTPGAIIGGMLGGSTAGIPKKIGAMKANIARSQEIPTTSELYDASNERYKDARASTVPYQPEKVQGLANTIRDDIHERGFRPSNTNTYNALDELRAHTGEDGTIPPTFADIESTRQWLGVESQEIGPNGKSTPNAVAARMAIGHIDDFLSDPSNAVIRQGMGDEFEAARVAQLAKDARDDWAAASGSKQIEDAVLKGEHRAASTGTGSNFENVTRQQIRSILDNPRRIKGYSPEERQMMEQMVMGNVPRNSARLISKLAATGIVSAAGTTFLAHSMGLGPVGHVALPVIGYAAKKIGEAKTRANVSKLLESVRADSPLGRERGIPPETPSPSLSPYAVRGLAGAFPTISGTQP